MTNPDKIRKVTLIGSGNVAWQLGQAFIKAGINIVGIYSRNAEEGNKLAFTLNSSFCPKPEDLNPDTDLFLLAVADAAIKEVLPLLPAGNQMVVHTAGSVGIDALTPYSSNAGVFYPLQTLSKLFPVDFSEIPVCIEASNQENLQKLYELASEISGIVQEINSEQRMMLHISAVFACNYTNLMYTFANDLLIHEGLNFDLIKPLIVETARKAVSLSPQNSQTGPARRNDLEVIQKHIALLASQPEYAEIYRLLAERIRLRFQPKSE
jgi:predicted short-subunit dehydrogenase-like oxidoreductase (DUF2520 family)